MIPYISNIHEYGPNVYIQPWFEKNFNRGDLEIVWRHYWFFIHENNLAPIHIGEWGGKIEGQENQDNLKWMTAFRDFIVEQRLNHTFWCLNQDSGDTGGLITGSDWKGFDYHKYDFIKPTLWQDADGNFVGLDHKVPLWPEGILIPDYYRNPGNLTPPPSYTPYPTGIYPNQTYPPYPTQPGYPTPTPTSPEYPTPSPTRPEYPGRGDVNGDGDIDIVDALIIASYYVQLPTPIFDPYAADVDNNGIIDIVDALLVAKIAVGLIKY
jgi:endoglucanase